jgi:hypothetical protein
VIKATPVGSYILCPTNPDQFQVHSENQDPLAQLAKQATPELKADGNYLF